MEFKTDPFNVDGADTKALSAPIYEAFMDMKTYTDGLSSLKQGEYSPLNKAKDIEVRPDGILDAKPQVTGGVRVDLVLDFLKDMASADAKPDLMPGKGKKATLQKSVNYVADKVDESSALAKGFAGLVVLLSNLVRRFQADGAKFEDAVAAAREKSERSLEKYKRTPRTAEALEEKEAKLERRLKRKIVKLRRELAPSYAKSRASALPRVAFNDLPGVKYAVLLKHVLLAAGLTEQDGGRRMFPVGLKVGGRHDNNKETIAEWIAEIQKDRGRDKEGELEEGELWSERALQAGRVGAGDKQGAGIPFELRGLKGSVAAPSWLEFAVPFLMYFRRLNEKAKPAKD